jgi:hypothetical protein
MAMDEVETLTDFARRFDGHNGDYGTDIRDAGTPIPLAALLRPETYPFQDTCRMDRGRKATL